MSKIIKASQAVTAVGTALAGSAAVVAVATGNPVPASAYVAAAAVGAQVAVQQSERDGD